jgi:hypothetical protein
MIASKSETMAPEKGRGVDQYFFPLLFMGPVGLKICYVGGRIARFQGPALLIDRLWPMAVDKTNLSMLRLINFLCRRDRRRADDPG